MKRLIGLIILMMTLPVLAQSPASTPQTSATPIPAQMKQPEDPAHQELRDLHTKMQDAMNGGDVEGLLEGVTDDVVFSNLNGDVVRGKDAIRDYFKTMISGEGSLIKNVQTKFETDDLTILYPSSLGELENTGVAFGHSNDKYELADGTKFAVNPRWTATMVREPDGWKVASFHYSVNAFDNPIMNQMRSGIAKGASVAAVFCLLLGFVFGRFAARKK